MNFWSDVEKEYNELSGEGQAGEDDSKSPELNDLILDIKKDLKKIPKSDVFPSAANNEDDDDDDDDDRGNDAEDDSDQEQGKRTLDSKSIKDKRKYKSKQSSKSKANITLDASTVNPISITPLKYSL